MSTHENTMPLDAAMHKRYNFSGFLPNNIKTENNQHHPLYQMLSTTFTFFKSMDVKYKTVQNKNKNLQN